MKKLLLTFGSLTLGLAPIMAVVSCGTKSTTEDPEKLEDLFETAEITVNVKNTDFDFATFFEESTSKKAFLNASAFVNNNTIKDDAYSKLVSIKDALYTEANKLNDTIGAINLTIRHFTKAVAPATENIIKDIRLKSFIITNEEGKPITKGEVSTERLKALIMEAIVEHSSARSAIDDTTGKVASKSYLADALSLSPQLSNYSVSDYWVLKDHVFKTEFKQAPVSFDTLVWNPYKATELFNIEKSEKTFPVSPPDTNEVYQIDGTIVSFAKGKLLPTDVVIDIYSAHRRGYNFELSNSNISNAKYQLKNETDKYSFIVDNKNIYQNIWLKMRSTSTTSFIPAKYSEWFEIIKLGNGVAKDVSSDVHDGIPGPHTRRKNYGFNEEGPLSMGGKIW